MKYTKEEIGKKLRNIRESKKAEGKKWTRQFVADRTQGVISPTRLANYENGERMPGLDELKVLSDALGVPVEAVLPDGFLSGGKIISFPGSSESRLDDTLLGMYLETMDRVFPEYGLENLDWFQKTAMAKIGYDRHFGKKLPDEETVTAEVIQWAEVRRALGGS